MTFESLSVTGAGETAEVTGNLTIRGVTRPVTLVAQIFRPQGSATYDRSRLTVRLTGRVNRSDFGATGWSDMVGDEVRIVITARIDAMG
jgi:polyisoprenoid-binding protein YceI